MIINDIPSAALFHVQGERSVIYAMGSDRSVSVASRACPPDSRPVVRWGDTLPAMESQEAFRGLDLVLWAHGGQP
jgi:hypothetical protein